MTCRFPGRAELMIKNYRNLRPTQLPFESSTVGAMHNIEMFHDGDPSKRN